MRSPIDEKCEYCGIKFNNSLEEIRHTCTQSKEAFKKGEEIAERIIKKYCDLLASISFEYDEKSDGLKKLLERRKNDVC